VNFIFVTESGGEEVTHAFRVLEKGSDDKGFYFRVMEDNFDGQAKIGRKVYLQELTRHNGDIIALSAYNRMTGESIFDSSFFILLDKKDDSASSPVGNSGMMSSWVTSSELFGVAVNTRTWSKDMFGNGILFMPRRRFWIK